MHINVSLILNLIVSILWVFCYGTEIVEMKCLCRNNMQHVCISKIIATFHIETLFVNFILLSALKHNLICMFFKLLNNHRINIYMRKMMLLLMAYESEQYAMMCFMIMQYRLLLMLQEVIKFSIDQLDMFLEFYLVGIQKSRNRIYS